VTARAQKNKRVARNKVCLKGLNHNDSGKIFNFSISLLEFYMCVCVCVCVCMCYLDAGEVRKFEIISENFSTLDVTTRVL